VLKVKDLCFAYGNIPILRDLNFYVKEGIITALLGSNGAGKSTTLLTISGLYRANSGMIEFCDERIDHLAPHEIASRGLIHVPEGRELFSSLTVLENLEMGCAISAVARKAKQESYEHVLKLFPVLKGKTKQLAGSLSGGEQQMLAIGRGIMSRPRLLLMDEPSLGLAPLVVKEVFHMVVEVNCHGVTILLVEQNALRSLSISERVFVMENGNIAFAGIGKDLLQDERVKKAYLGI
jgi:branched-chain amino acid transport system ATP-binding protein